MKVENLNTIYPYSDRYMFSERWFDGVIPVWKELFKQYKTQYNISIKSVLEVGCYEGRATVWVCENVLNDINEKYHYDIIDTFGGSLEEFGMEDAKNRLNQNQSFIESNFRHNVSFFPNINFNIYKGISQTILPTFESKEKYDFIYIDASHRADDTLVDAYYAHKMLKKGGILIFDDFLWKDPNMPHPVSSPQLGVETFIRFYDNHYHIAYQGYQLILIKN